MGYFLVADRRRLDRILAKYTEVLEIKLLECTQSCQDNDRLAVLQFSECPWVNQILYLWKDLKMTVHRHSPSNPIQLERICQEWEKLPKYRSTKVVETCPRWIKIVIAAKGASAKYRRKGLIKWHLFLMFNEFAN